MICVYTGFDWVHTHSHRQRIVQLQFFQQLQDLQLGHSVFVNLRLLKLFCWQTDWHSFHLIKDMSYQFAFSQDHFTSPTCSDICEVISWVLQHTGQTGQINLLQSFTYTVQLTNTFVWIQTVHLYNNRDRADTTRWESHLSLNRCNEYPCMTTRLPRCSSSLFSTCYSQRESSDLPQVLSSFSALSFAQIHMSGGFIVGVVG